MSICKFAIVVLSLILSAHALESHQKAIPLPDEIKEFFSEQVGSVDIACMFEHCLAESVICLTNQGCRDAIICDQKCLNEWDSDTTKEKFHIQNCTNICAWTYVDKTYQKFIRCLTTHQCLTFPPIPKTCRAPNIHPLKQLSIKDLEGDWWVVKGLHPVYDCYPCPVSYTHLTLPTIYSV